MSTESTVVFLHGMGQHDATFHEAAWAFLQEKHQSLSGQPLAATAIPFVYDDIFESLRQTGSLADLQPFIQDAGVLGVLQDLQASDLFLYTHVLDVLIWRFHTVARTRVITKLAAALSPLLVDLTEGPDRQLVVIAHSLGTAVATDVIHLLAEQGVTDYKKLPAIHMLANVAKVLEPPERPAYNSPPQPSLCRPWTRDPADKGALQRYHSYRNELDPIPLVDAFRPPWSGRLFQSTTFKAWGAGVQPHDILTYVKAPEVYMPLLWSITLDEATYTPEREQQEIAVVDAPNPSTVARQAVLRDLAQRYTDKPGFRDFLKLIQSMTGQKLW